MSMALNEKNKSWKTEFFDRILKENAQITPDSANLIITTLSISQCSQKKWRDRIKTTISEFFKEFNRETIKIVDQNITDVNILKNKINNARSLYLIDWKQHKIKNEEVFYYMGRKKDIKEFFNDNRSLKQLRQNKNQFGYQNQRQTSNNQKKKTSNIKLTNIFSLLCTDYRVWAVIAICLAALLYISSKRDKI